MLDGYEVLPNVYDEAFVAEGEPRPHYRPLLEALERADVVQLARRIEEELRDRGVTFGASRDGLLALDPVPRLLTASEWQTVSDGVTQRARALDSFAADVYGERAIVSVGVVPERVIESSEHHEPAMRGCTPARWVSVVGFDLVRAPDGRFRVLEDQIRMPSGIAYAAAARAVLESVLPVPVPPMDDVGRAVDALGAALAEAAPRQRPDARVVLLSEGPEAAGWYEHARLASELGISVVTAGDLERMGPELYVHAEDSRLPVDVVYQRTDEDRLTDTVDDRPTEVGELLLEPCRAGRVACVNAPGAGVADDKLVHAYVEDMIRFYLDEEPVLGSLRTHDLGTEEGRATALGDAERMVFKPRAKMGGEGVVVWSQSRAEERDEITRLLDRSPEALIAQERAELSVHPTFIDGALRPRRVDLRPYVVACAAGTTVLRGGLTRVALEQGSLIVNSGQGGGVEDTWVLDHG